ncbi:cobalamin B12-binding domain-containing protein [Pseudonocardia humida]|uniref:Cobalamin B12-binding domain-containing protein n=1 Tax=Pseudonocardia humida TaxID=2800819 RepID=A0ABT0ZTK3_9PSEU|nr:cobalamin B12-binding domain-containing protein [Pseudonocardia humida]MCO1654049.1 cobalamin B12-binding domain-containing protein [Pseudonocardia humida]
MTTAPPRPPVIGASVADEFFDALTRADEQHALDLAGGLVADGTPVTDVLLDLVGPAQERVGLLWQTGEWSVAQEHAATCINERVVAAVGGLVVAGDRGHVVLGCLDGEWHALPARIVGEVLRQHGWRVTFLGASVPTAHLISYLHEQGPDVAAVSCALAMHLPGAHRTIAAAQRTGTPVLAGGPGFGADGRWARLLGVDAYAATATGAVDLLATARWVDPPGAGRAAVPETGGAEYAALRERRTALVRDTVARLGGASPPAGGGALDGDAVDDTGQLVDFLAAAVYLGERDLFADHVRWLCSVLSARKASTAVVRSALDRLDEGLHDFPFAQGCIAGARELLDGARR